VLGKALPARLLWAKNLFGTEIIEDVPRSRFIQGEYGFFEVSQSKSVFLFHTAIMRAGPWLVNACDWM
jgi:hypothetical protein